MYPKFIAAVAAASLFLTALGAAPALADDRTTARTIAAIAGLVVVGKLIHDRNKRKKEKRREARHAPVYDPSYHHKPRPLPEAYYAPKPKHQPPAYHPPATYQPKPRPLPRAVDHRLLPQECFRTYETYRGRVAMFAERCLQRNFRFTEYLPRQCRNEYNTPRGDRRGYDARCLRDRGYRLARR